MGWFALGAAAISAAGGIYSSKQASKAASASKLPATVYNAYGEPDTPSAGAIKSRDSIFDTVNGSDFQAKTGAASNDYIKSLLDAANNPALAQTKAYNTDVINGKYLNSPLAKGYGDQAYNSIISQGANQDARIQANFANNGLGFSTGMQQAQQANKAATASQAATTRAGILSNNYQAERQLQQGAVGNELALNSATPSYLSSINSALYAPYSAQAGLTTQLLGNPVSSPQPTYVQNPTGANGLASGVSTASGLFSLFNNIKQSYGGGAGGNSVGSGGAGGASDYAGYMCWVAREVYGETDSRWMAFRSWLLNSAPVEFVQQYLDLGAAYAKVLSRNPVQKAAVRDFMDSVLATC